jgi:hypothetical protein
MRQAVTIGWERERNSRQMTTKKKIFIPQEKLEAWVNEGKISMADNVITTLAGNRVSYTLIPAFKFVRLTSGDTDSEKLIGLVKTKDDIKHLKPDIFMDSIIIGDKAYEVEMGYIGNLTVDDKELDDIALLSRYILENI